jgi:hypothetical protein
MISNCKVIGAGVVTADYLRREPGIQRGHTDYVMSSSELHDFSKCPARWLRGHRSDDDDTASTEHGTLVDLLALQPEKAESLVICPETYPDSKTGDPKPWTFAANYCKDWREQHKDKKVVKAGDHADAQAAATNIWSDPRIMDLLQNSDKQVMVVGEWKDDGITVPLRGLLDLVPNKISPFGSDIADLKTCRDASHYSWTKQVYKFGYHVQSALYIDLYNAATGEARNRFLHVLCENKAPWQVGRRFLSPEFLELGRQTYQSALRQYCKCLKENRWPDFDADKPWGGWTIVEVEPWMILNSPEL